jgi:hypothetical protein
MRVRVNESGNDGKTMLKIEDAGIGTPSDRGGKQC